MVKDLKELKLHLANLESIIQNPEVFLACSEDVINAKLDLQDFEATFHNFSKETSKYLDKQGKKFNVR